MKSKGTEKNHAHTYQKEAEEPASISHKADGRTRKIIRDKRGYYIMKKGSIL